LGVQSWIEIISGGTWTKKVEYHCSSPLNYTKKCQLSPIIILNYATMLECSNVGLQVFNHENQQETPTYKSEVVTHKSQDLFHSFLGFRLSCSVHINKNISSNSEKNQAGLCFTASINFSNSACKMLKFYNTHYKSHFSVTRPHQVVGMPFTTQKMLSQRRLLIQTQYKSEQTIHNNFNRKTVKVYIKIIVIKKYILSKMPSSLVL
jgi:hypothetical protein